MISIMNAFFFAGLAVAPVQAPPPALMGAPPRWHLARRAAILEQHPEVGALLKPDGRTLPSLVACNAAQLACALGFARAPAPVLVPLAILVGGTLSLWQFALLHDVRHGTAALPAGLRPSTVLFLGSLPSVFGYFLYLQFGHLTHHKDFGRQPLRALFDSERSRFEDGDALFVAHRQLLAGDAAGNGTLRWRGADEVGGLGLSLSRFYFGLWREARPLFNAAVYTLSTPRAAP